MNCTTAHIIIRMAYFGLPAEKLKACADAFDEQLKKDDEKERDYLTYEELRAALEKVLGYSFRRDNVFFKLISELDSIEPNKIRFNAFMEIYSK